MKAIRKSDGKLIEVTALLDEYYSHGVCYKTSPTRKEETEYYNDFDLDFDVEETEEAKGNEKTFASEEVTIDGWVCRDEVWDKDLFNSNLFLATEKPKRGDCDWYDMGAYIPLNPELFPTVTWESDPLPVTLTIKAKKNEKDLLQYNGLH